MQILKRYTGPPLGPDTSKMKFEGYYLEISPEQMPLLEEINLTAGRTGDLTPEAAEYSTELAEKITKVLG